MAHGKDRSVMMSNILAKYKQTEVGVIPVEWEVKKLEAIADVDPDNLSNSTNPEYSFLYISLEDVDYGTLRNTTELLFKNAPSRARRKIRKDDILLSTVRPNLKSHLLIKKEISHLCLEDYCNDLLEYMMANMDDEIKNSKYNIKYNIILLIIISLFVKHYFRLESIHYNK